MGGRRSGERPLREVEFEPFEDRVEGEAYDVPWRKKKVKRGLISVSIISGNSNVLVHAKQKCFMHLKLISNNDDDGNQKARFLIII